MQKPAADRIVKETAKERDSENRMSAAPKPAEPKTIQRPRPVKPRLDASKTDPISEPAPFALISRPKPRGPACKILAAKTGMSTVKGAPSRLTTARARRIRRTGAVS